MVREILRKPQLNKEDIVALLGLDDFSEVYKEADRVRRENVGDTVHLRAIIEFSNICKRQCIYCGLNRDNKELERFRMSDEEIVEVAKRAVAAGYRTIVLQSGEDDYYTPDRLGSLIERIKKLEVAVMHEELNEAAGQPACRLCETSDIGGTHDLGETSEILHPIITVSCGEKSEADYAYLKSKGADRYLLKHETADAALYDSLHPCGNLESRVECLKTLKKLGYETGSGFMVGLPGQTLETLAEDLLLLKDIPCKMAGIGPFISNPKTPLAGAKNGDPEMARRCVAIARLLLPDANLPLTTALSILSKEEQTAHENAEKAAQNGDAGFTLNGSGDADSTSTGDTARTLHEENPFAFGANVIMKKVTPDEYKKCYEIYPAEFAATDVEQDRKDLEYMITYYGRTPL